MSRLLSTVRRIRPLAVSAAAAVACVLIAMATPAYGAAGDSVVGKGSFNGAHFAVDFQGTGTGTDATGTFHVKDGKVFTKYSASCLDVGGSNAWVGLTVTDSSQFTAGTQFVYLFADNLALFDGMDGISAFGGLTANNCGADPSPSGYVIVTHGGFTVTDGGL